jgi:hypothetical protein
MATKWPAVKLTDWVSNACASMLWEGNTKVPISIAFPARQKNTSYLFSPRSGWFDYLTHEYRHQPVVAFLIATLGKLSYFLGIDKTIFVGNYPISTSIWTSEQENDLPSIANKMRGLNPGYFIGIRNLLPQRHPILISNLKSLGYLVIPSRVIYEFDLRCENAPIPSHLKRDLALLKKFNLDVQICSRLDQDSLICIHDLYQKIYLHKHSLLNPQYTVQFFDDVVNRGVMSCLLVRGENQQICSFALLLKTDLTLSVPALGYDTKFSLEGSYRVLFAAIYTYAKDQRLLLNYSSGAGDFKRKRGGIGHLEYTYLICPFKSYGIKKFILALVAKKTASLKAQDLIELGA